MADSGTIREFLATLGFKIDEDGLRKFTGALTNLATRAAGLGLALEGAAVAVGAAVTAMADHFEQLFFLSQRVGSSIENITAFEYGLRQIGLSASTADAAISSLSMAMQMNPGMEGLLHGLGVQTRDAHGGLLDTEETLDNLIGRLKGIQFPIASRLAQMFGIDPTTLKQMELNLDATRNAMREWHQEAARAGVDLNAFGENAHAWMVQVRGLGSQLDLIWYSIVNRLSGSTGLLPVLQQLRQYLRDHFDEVVQAGIDVAKGIVSAAKGVASFVKTLNDIVAATVGWRVATEALFALWLGSKFVAVLANVVALGAALGGGALGKLLGKLLPLLSLLLATGPAGGEDPEFSREKNEEYLRDHPRDAPGTAPPGTAPLPQLFPDAVPQGGSMFPPWANPYNWKYKDGRPFIPQSDAGPTPDKAASEQILSADETAYQLPSGVLDKVWWAESNRGDPRQMHSPAGAEGHFQFMPGTAKQYGVSDPFNLAQSAAGAAHYIADLLKKYSGDLHKAIAAYNWGPGNLDKDIRAYGEAWEQHIPRETHQYLGRVLGTGGVGGVRSAPSINQNTTINVNGATDPHRVGQEVAVRQRGVNSDLVRSATGGIYA